MQPSEQSGFNRDRPLVAGLDSAASRHFLSNHLVYANLQRKGSISPDAPDLEFTSNEGFWNKMLNSRRTPLKWVKLTNFRVIDWFPRAPGLYYTGRASSARGEAEHYVREENGIRFYEPQGKIHMIEGGVGSVRFKPISIYGQTFWLYTATSEKQCHSGIPLAIPSHLIDQIDDDFNFRYEIKGQISFLPELLEHHFYHWTSIPQIYVVVDSIRAISLDRSLILVTPMVYFTMEPGLIRNAAMKFRSRRSYDHNVTYVTCPANSPHGVEEAIDWIEWYVRRYRGEIVTNFDQQRLVFEDAPFSLQRVMEGKLDKTHVQEFHIGNAEIICDTIHAIHTEVTTMSHIEVLLGDGTTIHGDFVVANSIKDSFNKVASSNVSDDLKESLKQLAKEVARMSETLPKDSAQQAARDLETLTAEATSQTPRKQWIQLSAEGLKQAAINIGAIGTPVLDLLSKIVPLLVGG